MGEGERLEELLEVQASERRGLIGRCSDEYFRKVCNNQEKEIFKLLNSFND